MRINARKTIRLPNYNYSSPDDYFVTICTKNKQHYFGEIIDNTMYLSKIGLFVRDCWLEIPDHFKYVELDEFAVMPNHIHGIISIIGTTDVGACHGMPLRANCEPTINEYKFGKPQPNSIPMIINQFKGTITRCCRKNNIHDFQWQRNYFERIIRNEHELNKTREYIINNPYNWANDRNNPANT